MKRLPFFVVMYSLLSCVIISSESFAQSTFNYGQNKNVYFISSEERRKLAINDICEVNRQEDEFICIFTVWKFTNNEISSTDLIFESNEKVRFSFDSMLKEATEFRSYFQYVLENGKLSEYGSSGKGVHDWNRIKGYPGTSIVETTTGGGSPPHLNYTKNLFDQTGRLLYSIHYPEVNDTLLDVFLTDDTLRLKWFNYHIQKVVTGEHMPDTIHYQYNSHGQLTSIDKEKIDINNPVSFFRRPLSGIETQYVYIGKRKMEEYLKEKIGYLPRVILLAVYRYGVMSFFLNAKNEYHKGRSVILEKNMKYE